MTNIEHNLYIINWNHTDRQTYLFGSRLQFLEDGAVSCENAMMPAGTVMQEWNSRIYDTISRKEPALPLLIEGKTYTFRIFHKEAFPGSAIYRVNFYDREEKILASDILNPAGSEVECPQGTYYYVLSLINAGFETLSFHSIEIDSDTMLDSPFGKVVDRKGDHAVLYCILPERIGGMIHCPSSIESDDFPAAMVVPYQMTLEASYFSDAAVSEKLSQYTKLHFLSYSPDTVAIAEWLSERYPGSAVTNFSNLSELRRKCYETFHV